MKINELPNSGFAYVKPLNKETPRNQAERDFQKIKEFLKLEQDWDLTIAPHRTEGFCYRNQRVVMIGTKNGYKRKLLVHECLHAAGLNHYDDSNYCGVLKHDDYSAKIEKEIFAVLREGD